MATATMNRPQPRPPVVGWLDLDEASQRSATAFLAGIAKSGTVDELGFGDVRQVYASLFFPATNTQMRRAIYFLTVPALCRRMEVQAAGARKRGTALDLDGFENQLRRALEAGKETVGIIGISSGDALVRQPSSIYWGPLLELGILRRPLDRGAWLAGLGSWSTGPRTAEDDDRTLHLDEDPASLWDARALRVGPLEGGVVPTSLSAALTHEQAVYLKERFVGIDRRRGMPSLMGHLLQTGERADFDAPWQTPAPEALRADIEDARLFSLFARGATLHYSHLVTQAKHSRIGPVADPGCWVPAFDDWWRQAHDELIDWKLVDFRSRLTRLSARLNPHGAAPSLRFCEDWLAGLGKIPTPDAFLADETAAALVRTQESNNKPGRARLVHADRLRGWDESEGTTARWLHHLLYRAPRASMLLHDIVVGLTRAA